MKVSSRTRRIMTNTRQWGKFFKELSFKNILKWRSRRTVVSTSAQYELGKGKWGKNHFSEWWFLLQKHTQRFLDYKAMHHVSSEKQNTETWLFIDVVSSSNEEGVLPAGADKWRKGH